MNSCVRSTVCFMLFTSLSVQCMTHHEAQQKIFSPHTEDVEAAIQADPQVVNTKDADNKTPLHRHIVSRYELVSSMGVMFPNDAPENAGVENVHLILQNGGDPNAQDSKGNTAMHEAADIGRVAPFELLVQYGGFINAKSCQPRQDLEGATGPPHQSLKDAELGRHAIFKTCLEYGAKPRWLSSTASGITPFAIALLHDARYKTWNAKFAEVLCPYKTYKDEKSAGDERAVSLWELYDQECKHKRHLQTPALIEQLTHYACCGLGQMISRHDTFGTEAADFLESLGKTFTPGAHSFSEDTPPVNFEFYEKIKKEREEYIIPATLLHAEILRSFNTQSSVSSDDLSVPAIVNIVQESQLHPKSQEQMQKFVDKITSSDNTLHQNRIKKMLKMASTRVNYHALSLPAFRHIVQTYQQHITNEFDDIPNTSALKSFIKVRDQQVNNT